ncbi:MAG: hypothetical protein GVY29_12175 [Spirochaetes bacterium]|jgi:hypothetical protein|nr:hypothetical protein [Spirochaetota bacterium]
MDFFNDYSYMKIAEMRSVDLANEASWSRLAASARAARRRQQKRSRGGIFLRTIERLGDGLLSIAARIREHRHLPSRARYLGC